MVSDDSTTLVVLLVLVSVTTVVLVSVVAPLVSVPMIRSSPSGPISTVTVSTHETV